jgi:hypothetical protein
MDEYTRGRLASQVRHVRRHREQLLDDHDLCFTRLLPKEDVQAALERHQVRYRERLYTPLLTIWTFLYQVLSSDSSCRAAVARLLAFLCVNGQGSARAKTDPYCKARPRLPERLVADLARRTGRELDREVPPADLLAGRLIKQRLPQRLSLREVQVQVTVKGFRCRRLQLVTTLLDPQRYPKQELAVAFRCRWQAELDLRSIKQVMQMDVLRCKSPAMVRKEIWMHLLAYNLIRKLMAQAAAAAGVCPRDLSFKGALQTLIAFAVVGWSCPRRGNQLYAAVLRVVATHRVNDRPDRVEPRAVKRRPKKLIYLNEPRAVARARLLHSAP